MMMMMMMTMRTTKTRRRKRSEVFLRFRFDCLLHFASFSSLRKAFAATLQRGMQGQLPTRLSDADEGLLVNVLRQILNPAQSSSLLSGKYVEELQRVDGFLDVMMVVVTRMALTHRKSCTARITNSTFAIWLSLL